MVIPTPLHISDSCNTLVSLEQHQHDDYDGKLKAIGSNSSSSSHGHEFRRTALVLPGESSCSSVLHLPTLTSAMSCDEYLSQIPVIRQSAEDLLSNDHHHVFTQNSPEQVLYVHQAEVAHALPSQCDVLVSDRATTCHILVLRSTCSGSTKMPLTSMTHLDRTTLVYEQCLRDMIQQHKDHYHHCGMVITAPPLQEGDDLFYDAAADYDEYEHNNYDNDNNHTRSPIHMDVHILGGYCDDDGTSQQLSHWLLHVLADIAQQEEENLLQLTLQTCAISSLNNHDYYQNTPRGRGLAVDVHTGHVFLAKASPDVHGPLMPLRNARLWSSYYSSDNDHDVDDLPLHVIHTAHSPCLHIYPFFFGPTTDMDRLLELPDHALLHYTSTSPTVEDDDFCHVVRTTLQFVISVSCHALFGPQLQHTLCFVRCNTTTTTTDKSKRHQSSKSQRHCNQWQLVVMD